ncbi:MAG: hypothetical protein ACR2FU_01870 [Streptosporangiaceae bacterium]
MTSTATPTAVASTAGVQRRASVLRSWRTITAGTMIAAGATVVAGCLLPWASVFAGLIGIPGIRGGNGKLLAAAGALLAAAGIWHLIRGGAASRWLAGVAGAGVLGFSAFLLMRLSATLHSLGGDSMMAARGGPGLWLVAGGGLAAFGTLFFPQSAQRALVVRRPGGGLAAWAADRESAGPRRWVQLALGALWLLDAGLQAQPYMFSRGFITQTIGSAGMGNPAVLSNSITGVSQVLLAHPAVFNAGFAAIQLALGLGLLWRPTVRAALAGTIVWALWVWWLAEGLGGILTPAASAVTGAPGAALLYAVIAVLAWPSRRSASRPGTENVGQTAAPATVAEASPAGPAGARLIWIAIWAGAAVLTVLGLVRAPGSLRASLATAAAGEPGWLAAIDRASAHAVAAGPALPIALVVIFLLIAAGALIPATRRTALILAALAALVLWIAGQDLGGVLTGRGTDPNTGPLLILLAATYWPTLAARRRPHGAPQIREPGRLSDQAASAAAR